MLQEAKGILPMWQPGHSQGCSWLEGTPYLLALWIDVAILTPGVSCGQECSLLDLEQGIYLPASLPSSQSRVMIGPTQELILRLK